MNKIPGFEIITLCENSAGSRGFLGEHGIAMLVKRGNFCVLFDTGQGRTLVHNAGLMRVNLGNIDAVVLSHGHYDHTGGLQALLEMISQVKIYAHPDVFDAKYLIDKNIPPFYIGIPWNIESLESWGAQFQFSSAPLYLEKEILLTGSVPRESESREILKTNLYHKKEGQFFPDPLRDDQSLVLNTSKGLVVLLGCAHAGLVNILSYIAKITGFSRIYAVIGGMHLSGSTQNQIEEAVRALKEWGVKIVGSSHCTGFRANKVFAREFRHGFFLNTVGVRTIF